MSYRALAITLSGEQIEVFHLGDRADSGIHPLFRALIELLVAMVAEQMIPGLFGRLPYGIVGAPALPKNKLEGSLVCACLCGRPF
jgi:hypothetical protein